MFNEYVIIFEYFFIAVILALLLLFLSVFLVYQLPDAEKLSAYDAVLILMVMREINLKLNFIWLLFYLLFLIWN